MYKIAIDLGYGYTKGIGENGKTVVFPSVVGPGKSRELADALGARNTGMDKLHVEFNGTEYYVGELAIEESAHLSSATLEENKINHEHTKILLATAAALLVPQGYRVYHLVTGLPLIDYIKQKVEFEKMLRSFEGEINFKGGPLIGRKISIRFSEVTIFPQAAGAIYCERLMREIAESGQLTAVVDIGHKTTDFIVFRIKNGGLDLRADLSQTIDIGMSHVFTALQNEFHKRTRKRLSYSKLFMLYERPRLRFAGEELDFTDFIEEAKKSLARSIIDSIKTIWRDETDFIEKVYLAGGAAITLGPYLKNLHQVLVTIDDAQMANAKGFLKYAQLIPVAKTQTV